MIANQIGELFPKYQSGPKCTCLFPNNSRPYITASTYMPDTVFHTILTPTVCDSVMWIVEGQ